MGQNDPYGAPTPQTPPPSSSGRRWVLPVVIGVVCLLVGGGVGFAIGHSNGSSGSGNQADGSAATSAGPTSTSQTGAPQSGTAQSGAPQTSSAPSTTPAPTSSAPTGPTFTVNGTMTLVDPNASYSQGSTCNGSLGYNDITKGAQVTVTDPGGSTLATGELQEGQAQDSTTCLFHFSVAQVPEQSAYGIEVSNRGVVDESLDEMRQGVALELGDR